MIENFKGWPAITIRQRKNIDGSNNENLNKKIKTYLSNWQCETKSFAGKYGIRGFVPDWIGEIDNDSCCPKFSEKEIDFIIDKIESEKIIPCLNYAPSEFLNNTKNVWWIVPFCIWANDKASWIFIDKNGFYAAHPDDNDISMIFNWDSLENIEFEESDWDTDEEEVKTLNLTDQNGGMLTFIELVGKGRGSYLSVINSIYQIRKETIDKSKGHSSWAEGAGGEGLKGFERPQDLLLTESWKDPFRASPGMFGFPQKINEEENNSEN